MPEAYFIPASTLVLTQRSFVQVQALQAQQTNFKLCNFNMSNRIIIKSFFLLVSE